MCKMPNTMPGGPHVGPSEDALSLLSTFSTLGYILGTAHRGFVCFPFDPGVNSASGGAIMTPLYRRGN